jgi:hypothetical protein
MRRAIQFLAFTVLTVASLMIGPVAIAQTQASPPQVAVPSPSVSDQKLDAVAKAMERVSSIRQSYQQKIDAAAPGDKQRLATEGTDAMKKAITDQGLSLDDYNKIIVMAQNDPTFRARLLQRLQAPDQQH